MKVFLFALSFVGFWLLSSFSEAAPPPPVWYRVSSLELEKLEKLSAISEEARQRAEYFLKRSQETATALQMNSATLTVRLQRERETTRLLEKSFAQFVIDQSNSQVALASRATRAEIDLEKKKRETGRILALAIGEALAIVAYLVFKFRAIIRKMIPV